VLQVDLVRLDPGLPVPARAHPDDAGVDLASAQDVVLPPGHRALVGTGIAVALPPGYAAFVHPRSGLAAREGLGLLNAPGTVDAGYRGEIRVCLVNHDPERPVTVRRGDRVAQLVVQRVELPVFRVLEGTDPAVLPVSARGDGGFGSTGVGAGPGTEAVPTGSAGTAPGGADPTGVGEGRSGGTVVGSQGAAGPRGGITDEVEVGRG
jgi:dUTP pyrophosphatase